MACGIWQVNNFFFAWDLLFLFLNRSKLWKMIMKHSKGHHTSQAQEDGHLPLLQASLLYKMTVCGQLLLHSDIFIILKLQSCSPQQNLFTSEFRQISMRISVIYTKIESSRCWPSVFGQSCTLGVSYRVLQGLLMWSWRVRLQLCEDVQLLWAMNLLMACLCSLSSPSLLLVLVNISAESISVGCRSQGCHGYLCAPLVARISPGITTSYVPFPSSSIADEFNSSVSHYFAVICRLLYTLFWCFR